jgi:hypothetical protein
VVLYNTLSPLPWYQYDTNLTNKDISLSTIANFSPHIRIIRTVPQLVFPFQCTQPNELDIPVTADEYRYDSKGVELEEENDPSSAGDPRIRARFTVESSE